LKAGEDALRAFDQRFLPAPSSIDRLTVFVLPPERGGRSEPGIVVLLTTTRPFDKEQFLKQTAPEAKKGRGEGYLDGRGTGIACPGERMIAFGWAAGVEAWAARERPAKGPLSEGLALAASGKPLVIAGNGAALPPEAFRGMPPPVATLLRAKLVLLSF